MIAYVKVKYFCSSLKLKREFNVSQKEREPLTMKPVILSVKAYSYSISKGDGKTSKGKHKEYLNPIY